MSRIVSAVVLISGLHPNRLQAIPQFDEVSFCLAAPSIGHQLHSRASARAAVELDRVTRISMPA
jgi:hypothetical protein